MTDSDIDLADASTQRQLNDTDLRTISALARQQVQLAREVEEAEGVLKQKQDALKDLRERALPTAMSQIGLKKLTLTDGSVIEIAQAVKASIPKDRSDEAYGWLEEHGHGSLIKRRITIMFGRDQISWAKKFLSDCKKRKTPLNLEEKTWVEPQTLMAFVREQRKNAAVEGRDPETAVPVDVFGVYVQNYAKLSS